jgi:uncharacterized protein (DUF1778 family)
MGRPPVPKDQYRGVTIASRFRAEEREILEREAAKEGLTLSDWIRRAALEKIKRGRT